MVIAVLDVDHKIECSGNADLAFDLKIRTANRHIADQTVDPGSIERDCPGPYDFLEFGDAIVVHQNPLCQSVQNSPKKATRIFARSNDHGYPIGITRSTFALARRIVLTAITQMVYATCA